MLLQDKVAVITGSGRGIGRGIAIAMAKQGAHVVVNDPGVELNGTGGSSSPADQVVAEIKAFGGSAIANYDSVATIEGGERLINTAVDNFGTVHILANCAGILRDRMVWNMSEEEWDAVIAVHLKGHFATSRVAAAIMRKQQYGRIINFTSWSGLEGNAGQANYGAAKGGVMGLTLVLALELAKYNVTVNAIAPGASTRMTQSVPTEQEAGAAPPAEAEDIAPVAVFLASEKAAYINGQIVGARGGQIALWQHPRPIGMICKSGRWEPEELADVFRQSFANILHKPGHTP